MSGTVRGGPDEAEVSLLDIGKEEILLRLVEAVDLVDEEDRTLTGTGAGVAENVPEFGDVGEDGIETEEAARCLAGDHLGEGGFPAARRTVKEEVSEVVRADELGQEAFRTEHVDLSGDLVERARAHPHGQGLA